MALVGESGCGKTTTGRMIVGLLKSDAGIIEFKNHQINNLSKSEFRKLRSSIQIIFQDATAVLNPRMKIRKLLLEAIRANDNKITHENEIVEDIIINVGLSTNDLDRYPHEFSGGQRQRICIARAIAMKPDLIVCDEPVSALDLLVQQQILILLKDLQKKYNFSYIFISHNLAVVRYMSDRIAVMCQGKIVEEGTTEEIFLNPSHIYTKILLDSIPIIGEELKYTGDIYLESDNKYQGVMRDLKNKKFQKKELSDTHYVLADI